ILAGRPFVARGMGKREETCSTRLRSTDLKDLVQLRDGKNLADLSTDIPEYQSAADSVQLFLETQEQAQGCARQKPDVAKVHDQPTRAQAFQQGKQLLAQTLRSLLVQQDFVVREPNHCFP